MTTIIKTQTRFHLAEQIKPNILTRNYLNVGTFAFIIKISLKKDMQQLNSPKVMPVHKKGSSHSISLQILSISVKGVISISLTNSFHVSPLNFQYSITKMF